MKENQKLYDWFFHRNILSGHVFAIRREYVTDYVNNLEKAMKEGNVLKGKNYQDLEDYIVRHK